MLKRILILTFIALILVGCSQQTSNTKTDSIRIGEAFLKDQGYTIISHEYTAEPYELTQEILIDTSYIHMWSLQSVSPDQYLGKDIKGETFIIKNHPLDNYEHPGAKSLRKTIIHVLIVDGEVIGGTSFPLMDTAIYGGLYSLDGKSFGDIYPNVDWIEWTNNWIEKYSI